MTDRRPPASVVWLVFAFMANAGCASTYLPRPGHRVSMTMRDGALGYTREGVFYRGGMFGGQLEEAVAGNPEAMQHARTYRQLTTAGFGLSMGGLAVIVLGDAIASAAIFSSSRSGGADLAPLFVVIGAGLSIDIAGLILSMSGAPHLYDALNVYNDGVEFGVQRPMLPPIPRPQTPPPPAGEVRIGPIQPADGSSSPP